MPDSTADALLADITENPDDDTPRLVYADWLEDHGDSDRAEFIRMQLQRAKMSADDKAAATLVRREKAMLKKHPEWCDTGLGIAGEMRRGFLEHITCTPAFLAEHGTEVFDRFPIRSLTIRAQQDERAEIRKWTAQPWLRRVERLRVQRPTGVAGGIGDDGLHLLADAPHLTRLRVLELYACGIEERGASRLAAASHWRLTELQLAWNPLGVAGAQALAGAAHLAGLTRLDLSNTSLFPAGAAALAESPHLRNLRHLDVSRARIQVAGLRALAGSDILARVEVLNLGRLKLAVRAAQLLARCSRLRSMRELNLTGNRLEDEGAAALAASEVFANLTKLSVRNNRMSLAGISALAKSSAWPNLRELDATRNLVNDSAKAQVRGLFAKGVVKV